MAEEKMNLIQKVMWIRQEFGSAKLKKSGHNQYAGFDYFELEDIVPKAMEICTKYNVLPLVSFNKDFAVMTIIDAESGEKLEITSPMAEAQLKGCHPIQNMGATETYSRRYLWMAFLEVTEPDPSDRTQGMPQNNGYQPKPAAQVRTTPPSSAPEQDNRPAVAAFNPTAVWKEMLLFYGYDFGKPQDDKDNTDALNAARELLHPYAKEVKDLTPDKAEAIRSRLAIMAAQKGPEDFQDDADQVMGA